MIVYLKLSAILMIKGLKWMWIDLLVSMFGTGCAVLIMFLIALAGIALFIGVMMTN